MKRWIHATTETVTKEEVKNAYLNQGELTSINDDDVKYITDSGILHIVNFDKAAQFLNTTEGSRILDKNLANISSNPMYSDYSINEAITWALDDAYYQNYDCGVDTVYLD